MFIMSLLLKMVKMAEKASKEDCQIIFRCGAKFVEKGPDLFF